MLNLGLTLFALSIGCLFQTLIYIILVAIVISLIVWAIGYLAVPIPPIIVKLIVVLGVIICVYFLVMCLSVGQPVITR